MADWFTWLSQTPLDPSLVYNYGVLFACNELTLNDLPFFDHDFLLSMGVTVAKHRLEILKLARAKTHRPHSLSRLINSVASDTRRSLLRCAKKLAAATHRRRGNTESEAERLGRSLSPLMVGWKEIREEARDRSGPLDYEGFKVLRLPGVMADPGEKTAVAKSGPLGKKKLMGSVRGCSSPVSGHRRYVSGPINGGRPATVRSPRFSGPLDARLSFSQSPILDGPGDGSYEPGAHSPWAKLFDDLKPT
uniref:SAM domain-containing protein n=1 Tax=Kalanchoe fedtschenkoi TaxID=63787 RepID=A0A7N0RG52_KALFE